MYLTKIKEITANILFLNASDHIDGNSSFEKLGFSSIDFIDFIDFCYEVKAQINPCIEPHDIWPFARLLLDPQFCNEGYWTEAGRKIVNDILGVDDRVEVNPKSLDQYWTPEFCARRIETLLNA